MDSFMAVRLTSLSAVGVHLDAFADHLHETVVAEYRAGLQVPIERAVAEMEGIKRSSDYTHQGKVNALEAQKAKAREHLKPFHQRVAGYDKRIADTMAQALVRSKPKDDLSAMAAMMREREIRDRLMAEHADPLAVLPRLLQAIEDGDDDFVAAVMNAPAAYPLVDAAGREQARRLQISRSSSSTELETLERERSIIAGIVEAAAKDIEDAASFGVPGTPAHGTGADDPDLGR